MRVANFDDVDADLHEEAERLVGMHRDGKLTDSELTGHIGRAMHRLRHHSLGRCAECGSVKLAVAAEHVCVVRCRWCGGSMGRTPPAILAGMGCRARLGGPCERWRPGMQHWPPFIELDEYVDEETFEVKRRPRG